jgi:hypothetical protein
MKPTFHSVPASWRSPVLTFAAAAAGAAAAYGTLAILGPAIAESTPGEQWTLTAAAGCVLGAILLVVPPRLTGGARRTGVSGR